MIFRKADNNDISAIAAIYSDIHTAEEKGFLTIGWVRNVYPTQQTAQASVERGDMFVVEENGKIIGSAIINQQQVDVYEGAPWQYDVPDHKVMVLHTLVISPSEGRKGYGQKFVSFYEEYAISHGCRFLRMDTNARNSGARSLYKKMGYTEIGIVPCIFNGISGVQLVLLEKHLG